MVVSAVLTPLPALALAVAAAVAGFTHDAPLAEGYAFVDGVDALVYEELATSKPPNVPTWASHGGAAGCSPLVEGQLVDTVLVVDQDGLTRRMGFDEAWERLHDARWANDVYVVGGCR